MEVYKAVRTVLAVRDFQIRPVPDGLVNRIVEAARLTGSSTNGQPWHFIVVKERNTLRQLGSLVSSGSYNAQSAFAIVVAIDRSSQFGVSDASRAIQSMVLTAWSEGVGSNWTGWVGMNRVAALLDVPDSMDVIAVLPFGYPAHPRTGGRKRRKALSEVAHRERFGQPFS